MARKKRGLGYRFYSATLPMNKISGGSFISHEGMYERGARPAAKHLSQALHSFRQKAHFAERFRGI